MSSQVSHEHSINNLDHQPVYGELAIISNSGVEKQCMLLKKHEYTIGRSRRCDVRINIKTVSRLHVRIQRDRLTHKMTLSNCGSGEDDLFVNKILVKQKSKVPLTFGDIIELSGKVFKLYSPRQEHSVFLDETQLCSEAPIVDQSLSYPMPGGGSFGGRSGSNAAEGKENKYKKSKRSPSLIGFINGVPGNAELYSPYSKKVPSDPSDLALGTPDAEANTQTTKSVRFSHFNEVKADGIQAYSPATKRRRVADRKATPGPGRLFKSGQLPQEESRNPNSKRRLSERKQVLKRAKTTTSFKNKETQCPTRLLLTPTVEQKPKTEEERRKEIMRILLASSSPPDTLYEPPPKFVL